uniref:AlNc14C61G4456 protein n=1 Tax=Albugo laibachii Nc14 TaxID=890382 RepID=F0WCT0_9STRA|nr:AlNc14C61G4456 [Albugo laibachii Nc14]|eukprot:CCA18999.1 AlNc14C61G4456 [Albugo laibachii Nc14]
MKIRNVPVCYYGSVDKNKKRRDEWVSLIKDTKLIELDYVEYWEKIGSKKYTVLGKMLQDINQKVWISNYDPTHGLTEVVKCKASSYKEYPYILTSGFTHRGMYSVSVNKVEILFMRKDIDDTDQSKIIVDYSFCDKTKKGKHAKCFVDIDWLGVRNLNGKWQYQRYKYTAVFDTNGLAEDEKYAYPITNHTPGDFDKIITDKNQIGDGKDKEKEKKEGKKTRSRL